MRFLFFLLLSALPAFGQSSVALTSLDVTASLSEKNREWSGSVRTVLWKENTGKKFSFLIPHLYRSIVILDRNNETVDLDRDPSESALFDRITIDRRDVRTDGDTLAFTVEFTALFDSLSSSALFTAPREFILPAQQEHTWLPSFGSDTVRQASLHLTLPYAFTPFGAAAFGKDSVGNSYHSAWGSVTTIPAFFSICGIANAVHHTAHSADSSLTVTFIVPSLKVHPQYFTVTAQQTVNALRFFSRITGRPAPPSLTIAIAGSRPLTDHEVDTGSFLIRPFSPAYSVFDSAAVTRTAYNPWVTELARRFRPATTDSTALLDDGLCAYLASRFLMESSPATARQERFDAASDALTFFPYGPLAAGHTLPYNTNDVLARRGGYVFGMLEYLLGKESMDSVIRAITLPERSTSLTIRDLQSLCELQYGTPMNWFFDQWLFRSALPEILLQWRTERTVRGMTLVRVSLEQRGELFSLPVPIAFRIGPRTVIKRVRLDLAKQEFTFPFSRVPSSVDLDPDLLLLRWLLELRISAHARTSLQYLSITKDAANAEKEALYTLQLDPNNATGSAPLASFVLGNTAMIEGDKEKAKTKFSEAAAFTGTEEYDVYRLLSLVRYGNILDLEGKREEALTAYRRAAADGMRDPVFTAQAIMEAERFIARPFAETPDHWYEQNWRER